MFVNFLIEDESGQKMLDILLPKLLSSESGIQYKIYPYKGVGHLPVKGSVSLNAVKARTLLDNLPRLIGGFGKVAKKTGFEMSVVVVCDLDDKNRDVFMNQLNDMLRSIDSAPPTYFCLAIEEGEAWLLGDIPAIRKAYPKSKSEFLRKYTNDSICGTWELLADAIEPGGSATLKQKGYPEIGSAKCRWAEAIAPHMSIDANKSPSFNLFVSKVKSL